MEAQPCRTDGSISPRLFRKVEIGLDESKSCLYGVVLDQTTKRIGIQHLGDIKTLLDEENK